MNFMYIKYITIFIVGFLAGNISMYSLWIYSFKSMQLIKDEERIKSDKFLKSIGIDKSKGV